MSDGVVFGQDTAKKLYELVKPGADPPERKPSTIQPQRDPGEAYIFRNDSGETVPAFGCMRVTNAETDGTLNRYVIVIAKPNSTGGPFVFNGPREVTNGSYGIAYAGIVKAYFTAGTPVAGQIWGPNSGWVVESGGDDAIKVFGPIESTVILGDTGVGGSFDECGFADLEIVEVTTGYKIMVIDEEGCLKAAEFSECPPADGGPEEFSSASFFPGLGV